MWTTPVDDFEDPAQPRTLDLLLEQVVTAEMLIFRTGGASAPSRFHDGPLRSTDRLRGHMIWGG